MKIAIVGTGYVGLVTGTCFAEIGTEVFCVDVDAQKIDNLNKGIIPIYEPGLDDMVKSNCKANRLHFTTSLESVINEVDIIFSAVGTPPDEDGSADLQYVLNVAETIGKTLNKYMVVVTKSTVPVGTAAKVKTIIRDELDKRGLQNLNFDVASNPEFLKEGAAITDFMRPDRVIIGVESQQAKDLMERLYKPFMINNFRIIYTDIPSAEMIKYAANAMLATRISFMNDIAALCELTGADVNMVRKGIGSDQRIGSKFLYAGLGYGGSCFPKDVKALIHTAGELGHRMEILEAVENVNKRQKKLLFDKLNKFYKQSVEGKTIAIWGLAFKPQTNDIREATSLVLIDSILKAGGKVKVFDPVAMDETKRVLCTAVYYANDIYDAVTDTDALLMVTEWNEFRLPDWQKIKQLMKTPVIFDGRNIYSKTELKALGFDYHGIGI